MNCSCFGGHPRDNDATCSYFTVTACNSSEEREMRERMHKLSRCPKYSFNQFWSIQEHFVKNRSTQFTLPIQVVKQISSCERRGREVLGQASKNLLLKSNCSVFLKLFPWIYESMTLDHAIGQYWILDTSQVLVHDYLLKSESHHFAMGPFRLIFQINAANAAVSIYSIYGRCTQVCTEHVHMCGHANILPSQADYFLFADEQVQIDALKPNQRARRCCDAHESFPEDDGSEKRRWGCMGWRLISPLWWGNYSIACRISLH